MPYTVTKLILWLVGAAVLGSIAGYLFRGRPHAIEPERHPSAGPRPTDDDELARLQRKADRLDTQLSLALAERDRLRFELEQPRGRDAESSESAGLVESPEPAELAELAEPADGSEPSDRHSIEPGVESSSIDAD